eukprot:5121683-Prymnesium_polylepis.2
MGLQAVPAARKAGEAGASGNLIDQRARWRGEPSHAGTHGLDLGGIPLGLLLGDGHHAAQDLVHGLTPFLQYVDQPMLGARRVVVAVGKSQHLAGGRTRRRRAIVH